MEINIYLKKNNETISYGEMWRLFKCGKQKLKKLTRMQRIRRAAKVVRELNQLLPRTVLNQNTMVYYLKEE